MPIAQTVEALIWPEGIGRSGLNFGQISDQTHRLKRSLRNTQSSHPEAATRALPSQKGRPHAMLEFSQRFFLLID